MAAAGKWKLYDDAKKNIANGLIDLDTDSFVVALFLSTSNCDTLSIGTGLLADLTNQVATNFGYTQADGAGAGKAVTLTVAEAAGTTTVDETTNPVWTASGGSIVARFAVIFDDTAAGNPLLCVSLLDTAPADVTATTGNTLTITQPASGLFTLAGADAN
jgi:hypothetical protein